MSTTSNLDDRLRSVEQRATEAANERHSAQSVPFADERRNADEMIRWMEHKYESAGAHVDVLSATVAPGKTAYRAEVTMTGPAAKALFGVPGEPHLPQSGRPSSAEWPRYLREGQLRAYQSLLESRHALVGDVSSLLTEFQQRHAALPDWMRPIIQLDEHQRTEEALDQVFQRIDALCSSGGFGSVDELLAGMPLEGPTLTLLMGLLSITRPAAHRLPSRERFFERVYRLTKAMGRDADSLLGGLK